MFDLAHLAAALPAAHPISAATGLPAEGFIELGTAKVAQFVAFLKVLVVAGALFMIIKEYLKRQSIGAAIGAIVTASLVIWGVNHITWGESHVGDELSGSASLIAPAGALELAPVGVPARALSVGPAAGITAAGPLSGRHLTVAAPGHAAR